MKKSVLFLSFVAMIAMWSCGAKSNNGEAQGQDSTAMEQTIANKVCDEKKALEEKWAKFESLAADEQEALLAKKAEWFTKMKAACEAKQGECEKAEKDVAGKVAAGQADIKKVKEQIEAEWAKYEKMTVAEKKAFFDKVDRIMSMNGKKDCKDGDNQKSVTKEANRAVRTETPPRKIAPGQIAKKARTLAIRSDNTIFIFTNIKTL